MKYTYLWQIRYVDPDRRFGSQAFEHKARSLCNFSSEIKEIIPNGDERLKKLSNLFQSVGTTLDLLNEEHGTKNGLSAEIYLSVPDKAEQTDNRAFVGCKIYDDANIRTVPNPATVLLVEIKFNL